MAALGTGFCENLPEWSSRTSGSDSNASQGGEGDSVMAAIKTALAHLQLDVFLAQHVVSSTFFSAVILMHLFWFLSQKSI